MPNSSRWRFEAISTRRDKKRHRPDRCLKGRKTDWYKIALIPISSKSVLKRPKTELYKNVFMPNSSRWRFEAILTRREKKRHRPNRCLKGRKTDWYKNGLIPISSKSVLKRPKTELYKNVFMPNSSRWCFEAILTRRDKKRHRPDRCLKGPKTDWYKNVFIPNSPR